MLRALLRTQSLEQLKAHTERSPHRLRRALGAFDLTMFGIGAIIGAGIFSTIGTAAAGNPVDGRPPAGPALTISILLVALSCTFTGLAYAELSSMIPVAGSAYTYAYAAFGEIFAWVIGWDLLLEYAVSNVAVAISWADYTQSFLANVLGCHVPRWLCTDPRTAWKLTDGAPTLGFLEKLSAWVRGSHRGVALDRATTFLHADLLGSAPTVAGIPITVNLLAVTITVLLTWLVYRGIKESARTNAIMVILKVAILVAVVAMGASWVEPANYTPFAPSGLSGIQSGAAIIFFAFIGFDAVTTTAEECSDPARSLPRGILLSLGICTLLYVAVALVVTGMVHYTELAGKADPLAFIFMKQGQGAWAGLISFGAVIATTAALLVYQVGQPRIFLSMSRDGLLGPFFGRVSPTRGTPTTATLLTGALVAIPAGLLSIDEVVELANIGTLFAFAIVCGGVLVLRRKRPDAPRHFRMPWAGLLCPLGILSCLWLAVGLPRLTWARFFLWLLVGLVVYFTYGMHRSRLAVHDGSRSA